jgi:DNA mismatch repair protein MutS2
MSEHGFKEGSFVTILALKKQGVVTEVLSGGVCKVAIGSLTLTVAFNQLAPCSAPRDTAQASLSQGVSRRTSRVNLPRSVDLHGLTVDQAVRKLEAWLNQAIVAGYNQVQVVHGLGSGKVQRAVHDVLSNYQAVRAFRVNDANPGMTDVFIG